jgi:hypothetical protein
MPVLLARSVSEQHAVLKVQLRVYGHRRCGQQPIAAPQRGHKRTVDRQDRAVVAVPEGVIETLFFAGFIA